MSWDLAERVGELLMPQEREVPAGVMLAAGAGRRLPVIETFGPTIQGEGPDAGLPCCFVRFGGCDYRCSWCDSMYAVDPAEVKAHAEKLTVGEIVDRLPDCPRVILSGGNPALLELGPLVGALHAQRRTVSVETQGSVWRDWLLHVDRLVISPKPPSSGMATEKREQQTSEFLENALLHDHSCLKIVVFDDEDYMWSKGFLGCGFPLYLSAGTPVDGTDGINRSEDETVGVVRDRYRWLCERVANDPAMSDVRVLPQLHVLAWGLARGV